MGDATLISADAVENLQSFIRIPTVSGSGPTSGAYRKAAEWLCAFSDAIGVEKQVLELAPNKPIVLMTWQGERPELPAVLLNSHYDVVPVMMEHWNVDPFGGIKTEDGRIYGRGAQDMKCVCVQYLEAIKRLVESKYKPVRTVHLSFVPDEETGGKDGMMRLLDSDIWKSIQPIGFALDEGLANESNAYTVFYGERPAWWLLVKATGNTGHGSRFVEGTAMGKLIEFCNTALAFRQEQKCLLGHEGGCGHANAKKLGEVTTVNLTMLQGGVSTDGGETYALNVVPTEATAGFDVRISPDMPVSDFRKKMDGWCADRGLTWEFAPWSTHSDDHYITSLDRQENPWWGIMLDTMKEIGVPVESEIFPAGTDSRMIRELGIPAIGFSPMRNTPVLLHDHNEYIDSTVFLEGIDVYVRLLTALLGVDETFMVQQTAGVPLKKAKTTEPIANRTN